MKFIFFNKRFYVVLCLLIALFTCSFFGLKNVVAQTASQDAERASLQAELKRLEALEKQIANDITKTQAEKNTLAKEITTLKNRISQLNAQIEKNTIVIKSLGIQIQDTEGSIETTTQKIGETQEKLANVLRTLYEEQQKSLAEILLLENNLSSFFDNLTGLEVLNRENAELLQDVKSLKASLEGQKIELDGEKGDLERAVRMQTLQKQQTTDTQKQQESLLKQTQGKEAEYQKQLQDTQRRAAEIRARIFQLTGVPDTQAPTFGEALELAKWVQTHTGVRPAFLLSIITQESALGRNVGQCYIADTTSGAAIGISSGKRFSNGIHPSRDLPKLIQIAQEIGKDPLKTPISCPLSYGYGGAMGPAQFIPSTWMLVKNQVTSIIGYAPNPWSIKDSFMAAGVLLRDNGAATSETTAAARYFGSPGLGYESSVMQRASCIQVFIDKGTITPSCERLVFIP